MWFLINVYSRFVELKALLRCIRQEFGEGVKIGVYCNHENGFSVELRPLVDLVLTGNNSGHHNGVRDAYNSFVESMDINSYYVSMHADVLASDLNVFAQITEKMESNDYAAAFLDPGTDWAMRNTLFPSYYADCFVLRGDAYAGMFPLNDQIDGKLWIEWHLYDRSHKCMDHRNIWHVPNTCERVEHRDQPFKNIDGVSSFVVSGDDRSVEKVKCLLAADNRYSKIFTEMLKEMGH